ncbi:MAG: hypothetical protein JW969_15570 [Spirochaetales bacterium]|nr:hypothetical protein [Spirochaetales bacterium]
MNIKRDPSPNPPGGFRPEQVPQFIVLGLDDNLLCGMDDSDGFNWILEMFTDLKNPPGKGNKATFDGNNYHFTFYVSPFYEYDNIKIDAESNIFSWGRAIEAGHEIGLHTLHHIDGENFDFSRWDEEIRGCRDWLLKVSNLSNRGKRTNPDMDALDFYGFRAPFLLYNDDSFAAMKTNSLLYDSSIDEGFQRDQDGTNCLWPYTLDSTSPGNIALNEKVGKYLLKRHYPGLWEIPVYTVIVPPDDLCGKYLTSSGLRKRMKLQDATFDVNDGKITGFDWNLWFFFHMNKNEFLATMKYSLDLRYTGNRCPLCIGFHGDIYSKLYPYSKKAYFEERQWAFRRFIEYAHGLKDVRFVSAIELLEWLVNPAALCS